MALCPVCFNAPAFCECEAKFQPSADDRTPSLVRAAATATRESEDRLLREVQPERREALRAIVAGLMDLGAWLETPPAQVRNYVNVRVPSRFGPSRLCAITASTGRIEFQDESYPIVERLDLADRFDYLAAGEKAAITPGSDADVEIVVGRRRGSARQPTGSRLRQDGGRMTRQQGFPPAPPQATPHVFPVHGARGA